MEKLRHSKYRMLLCWTVVDNVIDNNIQQLFLCVNIKLSSAEAWRLTQAVQ